MRMWSGIWPPSKPLMATPVRAVWPLPPRPPVLPTPEPMPRPTRVRFLLEPGLSRSSFRRVIIEVLFSPALFADDANEVRNLVDHAAHFRRVLERRALAHLIEPEADKRSPLVRRTAGGAGDLLDGYCLVSHLSAPPSQLSLRPLPGHGGPGARRP